MPSVRIPALDGLRGIAVLLVLLAHSSNVGLRLAPALDFSGVGRTGVFLFFVLSAYLLSSQILQRESREIRRPRTWVRYLVRRFLRVYPAYLAWICLYFGLRRTLVIEPFSSWTLGDVGEHLVLLRGDRHLWTIPVELRWYLALPPIVVALRLLGGVRSRALAVLLLALLARLRWPPDYPIALGPYLPIFLAGVLAAVLAEAGIPHRRWGALFVVVGATGLALHLPALWGVDHRAFHLAFVRQAALAATLLFGLAWSGPSLRRPFELRVLRWIGSISYSAYLGHLFVLVVAERYCPGPRPLAFIAFLGGSLLLGWISHIALERPFARIWGHLATPGGKG